MLSKYSDVTSSFVFVEDAIPKEGSPQLSNSELQFNLRWS